MKLYKFGRGSSAANTFTHTLAAGSMALLLVLAGCGGDGGDDTPAPSAPRTATISGTAATGEAIGNAVVTATNSAGETATDTTEADGTFSLSIEEGAPYLLKVSTGDGQILYSFASTAGTTNITPLTTLALHDANGQEPLATLFEGWESARLGSQAVTEAAKRVNANLRGLYADLSVDADSFNFFTHAFSADGTGIDGVLDGMHFELSCSSTSCTETIRIGDSDFTYDFSISTDGIQFTSGSGGSSSVIPSGSTWELTLTGTASGQTINQTIGDIEFGAVPTTSSDAEQLVQQYGGSGSGNVSTPGVDIHYSFSGLETSYQGCGECGVGSTIVMTAKGTMSVSGTANGISIPPTTTAFDYTYTYERTH